MNIDEIYLLKNSQSIIGINYYNNSILMITYVYTNSSSFYIGSQFLDYNLSNLNYNGEYLSESHFVIKLYELVNHTNFYLKTVNLDDKNILFIYIDNSQFFYSVKQINSFEDNTKYSLTDVANCYGLSDYCKSVLSNKCNVSILLLMIKYII